MCVGGRGGGRRSPLGRHAPVWIRAVIQINGNAMNLPTTPQRAAWGRPHDPPTPPSQLMGSLTGRGGEPGLIQGRIVSLSRDTLACRLISGEANHM